MANREVFPGGIYPLQGDVESQAGVSTVTVVGIQGIPVSTNTPQDLEVLQYHADVNEYVPSDASSANKSIRVNGVVVSDDYSIGFNLPLSSTESPIFINGA